MTDQPTEAEREAAAAPDSSGVAPEPPPPPTFEERMERFGREAGEAGERWGRRAEAAGQSWSKDPSVVRVADTAGIIWGLALLAIGLWFFADVTLGLDMPSVAWSDIWPVAIIAVGLLVLLRGMNRRS
jgi:hypothetical protein